MRQRVQEIALAVFAVSAAVAVGGQARLPPDIKADSLSRLPLVQRAQLDADGQRIWDQIGGARGMPKTGPAPVSMYSPKAAQPIHELNQYLRTTVAGSRYFELSALIAAREFDQQYRVVGPRACRPPRGLAASSDRRREIQPRRDRVGGEGRHRDQARPGASPRSQSEPGAVGEDRRALRPARRRGDPGHHRRLRDGGADADRGGPTAATRPQAVASNQVR